jgi:uncharacterized phage-associated protein
MINFKFDEEKAVAATLYVAHRLMGAKRSPDLYKILKIFYFADKKHIVKYGRPILGDYYVAMDHGPVPSNLYDMLKVIKNGGHEEYGQLFKFVAWNIKPLADPDMDEISESELNCINESFVENKDLGFGELKQKSHDAAYETANKNSEISYRDIAKVAGASKGMIAYMQELSENWSLAKDGSNTW